MKYVFYYRILLFILLNTSLVYAQRELRGEYIDNIEARLIDSTNIDMIQRLEFASQFKLNSYVLDYENEFVITFEPQFLKNRILIRDTVIAKNIINDYKIKFILNFYEMSYKQIIKKDTVFSQYDVGLEDAVRSKLIAFIKTKPIKIINNCSKLKYLQFEQVQIIKEPTLIKDQIIIEACDTTFYPVGISSSPSGANAFIEDIKYPLFTPCIISKNTKPSLLILLTKEGYYPLSTTITNLKPNELNQRIFYLKPKNKDQWIFLGVSTVYGVLWYVLRSIDNNPKKIPSPPDLPY